MRASIFNFHSPIEWREDEAAISIKGFASVNEMDREREIVKDPREFDIPSFMTSPTLMVNHEFLRDEFGNRRSAGIVTKAVPVSVKEVRDDEVIVEGLDDPEFTDSICRTCAPALEVGDLGLFIHAQVHHEVAKEMVTNGEIGGLSWRGITRRRERAMCEGLACVSLKNIDLMEISLVYNQAQPQSTFMIAKSVDGEVSLSEADLSSLSTYAVRFSKAAFPTPKRVEAYLDEHSLASKSVEEDDESYVAYLAASSAMETEKSVSISIGGVELISAPEKNQDELIGNHVGNLTTNPVKESPMASQKSLRVFLLDEKGLAERFPGLTTQSMKSVATAEGEDIEIFTMEIPAEDAATPQAENAEETEVVSEDKPAEPVAENTVVEPEASDSTKPNGDEVESLQAQVNALKAQLEALNSNSATPKAEEVKAEVETPAPAEAEPVAETPEVTSEETPAEASAETETEPDAVSETPALTEKTSDPVMEQLQLLTASFKSVQEENAKLRETMSSLQNRLDSQTPSRTPREEDFMTQKSADSEPSSRDIVGGMIGRTFFTSTR